MSDTNQQVTIPPARQVPVDALAPLVGQNERIGGSRAQHDLIEFTLLKAYLETKRLEEARHLLSIRRPGAIGVQSKGLRPYTDRRIAQPAVRH